MERPQRPRCVEVLFFWNRFLFMCFLLPKIGLVCSRVHFGVFRVHFVLCVFWLGGSHLFV